MLRRNLVHGLVFMVIVGMGSLQAGEVPPQRECSDFDMVGECAQTPGATSDTCNEWGGASSCRAMTGAPSSCNVYTSACTAAGCGSMQTVTCEFSGVYNPEEVDCDDHPEAPACDEGGGEGGAN